MTRIIHRGNGAAALLALVTFAFLVVGPSAVGTAADARAAAPRCQGKAATIVGTKGSDHLRGTPGDDVIVARGGHDTVNGRGGRDTICGDGGNDVLLGGPGKDFCSGGAGHDRCDGGNPAPTTADPDTCADDVETTTSCHTEGLPQRWSVTFSGTTSYRPAPGVHEEVTTWSMTADLTARSEYDGEVSFLDQNGSGSGSYSVEGFNGDCTIEADGTFDDSDMSIGLRIDAGDATYDWDWLGLYSVPNVWHCPDGDITTRSTPVDAKEMVDDLAFVAGGAQIGHRVVEADNSLTHDYRWTLTPLG